MQRQIKEKSHVHSKYRDYYSHLHLVLLNALLIDNEIGPTGAAALYVPQPKWLLLFVGHIPLSIPIGRGMKKR